MQGEEGPEGPQGPPGPMGATGPQGPAGGGGGSFTAVTLSMPYPAKLTQRVNVIDAAVTVTSKILVSVAGVAETATNTSDFNDLQSVVGIPLAGSIDFLLGFGLPNAGPLAVNYAVSA